ncbi:hypothetical protein JCGZ_05526 [Jatropha curcas]|uniref:Pentacotripeptide-repeat region of PRORP domain-containing protein n=1 Tax=Jatropha curcas TaxID=180498 RepID=A0A067LII9_JATCU|nr:pentatricopeptide repeat-containing protein At2g15980 [Jatropha curcas]KDP44059.1 hypothetical protein JCGZ_05526 [Jatropha curcas]
MATSIVKHFFLSPPKPIKAYHLYSSASTPPSDQSHIVSTVVSLLIHHRSKSRWTNLRSLLYSTKTLTPIHFSQIALQLKSNPHLALRFFFFTLDNSSLCLHDLYSYSTIVHILSRARLKVQALSIIKSALVSRCLFDCNNAPVKFFEMLLKTYRQCDSAPFVFDLLIKSCLELKKIDGSIEIVRMLRSRGISPQIRTCNLLISCVAKCKGSCAGYGIFREIFGLRDGDSKVRLRPDVHSFNDLMMGFYRDGEMEMIEEVWNEMERFGCVPNLYSYNILMALFCGEGKMREAEKLWEEMRVKGLRLDVTAYNTIIGGFYKSGQIEKAEEFFKEMELGGVESNSVTFEHLINGYCKVGDVDSAILVYKDMLQKDFRPEASTIGMLIEGLCEKKRVSEALEIIRNAMRDVSFCPSRKSYELLIKRLCEDGQMEEALKLQAKMAGKGFEPDLKIYDAFIEGYKKLGNDQMAATLIMEMSRTQK